MSQDIFDKCKWCNGSGTERAHIMDTGYDCPDCEGTGMKGGKYAEQKFNEHIEEMAKKAKEETK